MKKVPTDVEKFAAKIADQQDNSTIHELAKAFPQKTYRELERYRNEDRAQEAGACIMGEMRKDREEPNWKAKYEKEHKLRRAAEGETSIIKGIGQNSPEMKRLKAEVKALKQQLHLEFEKK